MIELSRSRKLTDPNYACAATAPKDARLIFLTGDRPLDEYGEIATTDYAYQAAACIAKLKTALEAAGAALTDVISMRVLVRTEYRSHLQAAWEVVRDAFGDRDVPITVMGVTVLGFPEQVVEIEAVAAVVDSDPTVTQTNPYGTPPATEDAPTAEM